jgi:hypothetical protein
MPDSVWSDRPSAGQVDTAIGGVVLGWAKWCKGPTPRRSLRYGVIGGVGALRNKPVFAELIGQIQRLVEGVQKHIRPGRRPVRSGRINIERVVSNTFSRVLLSADARKPPDF